MALELQGFNSRSPNPRFFRPCCWILRCMLDSISEEHCDVGGVNSEETLHDCKPGLRADDESSDASLVRLTSKDDMDLTTFNRNIVMSVPSCAISDSHLAWRMLVYSRAPAQFVLETDSHWVEELGAKMVWRVECRSKTFGGVSDDSYGVVLAFLREYMTSASSDNVLTTLSLGRILRILKALGVDEDALEPIFDLAYQIWFKLTRL